MIMAKSKGNILLWMSANLGEYSELAKSVMPVVVCVPMSHLQPFIGTIGSRQRALFSATLHRYETGKGEMLFEINLWQCFKLFRILAILVQIQLDQETEIYLNAHKCIYLSS
jgi:hypothetical protein